MADRALQDISIAVGPRPDNLQHGLDGFDLRCCLHAKLDLESVIRQAPTDLAARTKYFDLLQTIAARASGLCTALLPELPSPLYFRAGTADIARLQDVFGVVPSALFLRAEPRRILVLGAFVGYAAVQLARRFPDAEIACVEPMPENFRLLQMNTLPHRQISCLNVAVWRHAARLSPRTRHGGDPGVQLSDEGLDGDRRIQAVSVSELLRTLGWSSVDFIHCDIVGAEASVFCDPRVAWLDQLDALILRPYDDFAGGAAAIVGACFDPAQFVRRSHAAFHVYERIVPLRAGVGLPAVMSVIAGDHGLEPMLVQNVAPVPWGFFIFDANSCQLHPNGPGSGPPARAMFPRTLAGHTCVRGAVEHAGSLAPPIAFDICVRSLTGQILAQARYILAEAERRDFVLEFPALTGRYSVVLQTEMETGAAGNMNAWGRWIDLRLA